MPISTRISRPAPKNRRDEERVVEDLMKQIKERVSDAMNYAAQASIYSPEDTFSELTTAQATVLTLFYGLLYGDVPLCEYIAQVRLPQLKSTFLRVWLVDDFSFKQQHVGMVLAMLSFLMDKNKLLIPNHIVNIFGGLVQKYDVADCCSKDLLTVFNEIHVQTSQHLQNGGARRKLSSSQSTCSEISNPDACNYSDAARKKALGSPGNLLCHPNLEEHACIGVSWRNVNIINKLEFAGLFNLFY